MSCANCKRHVEEALGALEAVKTVKVDLKKGHADVKLHVVVPDDHLSKVVSDAGYQVVSIDG